ncbi:hypothetical protein BBP40_006727 [Aspergillus hancockii]|nr:hypothetical protein BBP40_006727 [Aspergillus hancockii]
MENLAAENYQARERLRTKLREDVEEYRRWLETMSNLIDTDVTETFTEVQGFLDQRTPAPMLKRKEAVLKTQPSVAVNKAEESAEMFEDALEDESRLPPKCCGVAFSVSLAQRYLVPTRAKIYEGRAVELNDHYRTYCSNEKCGKYLRPGPGDDKTRSCTSCSEKTCVLCKRSASGAHCNSIADGSKEFIELAIRNNWKNCPKCHRMIERTLGCPHVM